MKKIVPQITVDEKMQFGKPVIVGTRVSVEVVVGHIAGGETVERVMRTHQHQ